ncbi:MAG TPA: enolase C-terminal domain-like protein, partial [Acidimicrobiales bacterium]|nr:enolase C-terminal domain-like protein [Acidimicrobiales bacterium]
MTTLTEHRLRLPLRVPLGGRATRDVVLLEGSAGWGEWSPLPGYPSDPAVCRRAAEDAACRDWPPPRRTEVEVNALIPGAAPDDAAEYAVAAVADGYPSLKVKVGDDAGLDRVAAVRGAVGPRLRIRVDANGAWDPETAIARVAR